MKNTTRAAVTRQTTIDVFSQWLLIVRNHESGSIIYLPRRDQLYRINYFIDQKEIIDKYLESNYKIISLDLATSLIDDEFEINKFINKNFSSSEKYKLLIVIDADLFIDQKKNLLTSLDSISRKMNLSILYFFRTNIAHPILIKNISPFTSIYQNIAYFPYLEKKDSIYFIKYLENKFSSKIPKNLIKQIIDNSGGIPILIKQACRYYFKTNDNNHLFDHPEMQLKLNIVWDELDIWDKNILEKIVLRQFNFNKDEINEINYLITSRLISKKNNHLIIKSILLNNLIREKINQKFQIKISDKENILINEVIMDKYFSKREKQFIKKIINNRLISREETAKIVWTKNEIVNYSDWALDQFISRIRKKLSTLGLNKDFIQTIKKHGFKIKYA